MNTPENHFITRFKEELKNSHNPKYLIQNEINQVLRFASNDEILKNEIIPIINGNEDFKRVFEITTNVSPEIFKDYFREYLRTGKLNGINESLLDEKIIKVRDEAKLFAEYYNWLIDYNNPNSRAKKPLITHKQKMLLLYYLGLDLDKYDNNKISKVLSKILEVDEENTRKYLSYLSGGKNNIRTTNNLKSVSKIFKDSGLNDISEKIEEEIKN